MRRLIFMAAITVMGTILVSCKDDDESDPGLELLTNNELEQGVVSPRGWFNFESPDPDAGNYDLEWTTEEALSGIRSLKISSTQLMADNFASWGTNIPFNGSDNAGNELTLTVWIKGNLDGTGVSIAIRGDQQGVTQSVSFDTTEGRESITGEFDWTKFDVTTVVESRVTEYVLFCVYLPQTAGEVFFDDVSLTIREN